MKKRVIWMLALLCTVAQGMWAQTFVSTEKELTDAVANGVTNILLAKDIQLSKYLDIDGKTLTIDLNGYKLIRILKNSLHAICVGAVFYRSDRSILSNLSIQSNQNNRSELRV